MALEFEKEMKENNTNYLENHQEKSIPDNPVKEEPADPFSVDLFGNPIDEKPKKEKPSKKATKPKKEDKLYDTSWLIFYAGHRLTVPEDGLLLDQVRAYLELEFPELSKERTEMLTDEEKKHIIPVVKGAKKG